jgi:hypothetical protein
VSAHHTESLRRGSPSTTAESILRRKRTFRLPDRQGALTLVPSFVSSIASRLSKLGLRVAMSQTLDETSVQAPAEQTPSETVVATDGVPRTRRRRKRRPADKRATLKVENDTGGPTTVYGGSVSGISTVVRIGHDFQRGVKARSGDKIATPKNESRDPNDPD